MAVTLISEFWYALSQVGKVVKQGNQKESVLSDEAFYYVRWTVTNYSTKYYLLNNLFEPAVLRYSGIVGKGAEFIEKENKHYERGKKKTFYMIDKSGHSLDKDFGGGIEAFKYCIQFMEELGSYGSLKEMTLTKQLNLQQEEIKASAKIIADLEGRNKELQLKLESIYESKSDLRKLTQLLYEN